MKYDINWLKQQANPELLFFWGHRPSKDGSVTKSCFSQWWLSSFVDEEHSYPTAEHYMMAGKAKTFKDESIFAKILETPSPQDVKSLGRKVKNFNPATWEQVKYEIVKQGNYLKFSQHESLKRFLLQTGSKIIVEASPYDAIWGIGLAESDEAAKSVHTWQGQNLLGFALMEVRDILRNE